MTRGRAPHQGGHHHRKFALAFAVVGLLAACGDDSGDNGDASDEPATTAEPTPTTHPSTEDNEQVAYSIVAELFDERDQLFDEVLQDPALLDEPDSDHIDRLREIGTENLDGTIDTLIEDAREMLDGDNRMTATGEMMSDRGAYRFEAVDADTITFEFCIMRDEQVVDSNGEPVEEPTVRGRFGLGEARRVDSIWKLDQVRNDPRFDQDEDDLTPGYLQRGHCDGEFGDDSPREDQLDEESQEEDQ